MDTELIMLLTEAVISGEGVTLTALEVSEFAAVIIETSKLIERAAAAVEAMKVLVEGCR